MSRNAAVYGIYANSDKVEKAVDELKEAGFRHTDISVLFPAGADTREFAVDKETKTPEGAATGAGTGAVVGGAMGWLVGIGALAIPGVGPFIAAGPIMAALAGAGAGGLLGGIAGALIGMGIPEYEAKGYEERIKKGGILLSVHTDDGDWQHKGRDILERTGAEDMGSRAASRTGHGIPTGPSPTGPSPTGPGEGPSPTGPGAAGPIATGPADTGPGARPVRREVNE